MNELQWIKLYVDIFTNSRKIKKIERLKNGDTYLVIWFKLLCIAGMINDGGMIYITSDIPFSSEDLADELKRPQSVVEKALGVFERYDMIERNDAGIIRIASWEKYQNLREGETIRTQTRERVARYRAKKNNVTSNAINPLQVTDCNAVERENKNKNNIYNTLSTERVDRGSVTNNILSEEAFRNLRERGVPDDYIEFFLRKIADRGYRYDDYVAAITAWWQQDRERWGLTTRKEEGGEDAPTEESFFDAALRHSYGDSYDVLFGKREGNG